MFVLNLVASRIGMLASWFFTTSKVLIVVKKLISIPVYCCLLIYCDCCDCDVVYIAVYWFIVTLLWLWRCLFRCLLIYCDVVVTVALFISLLTDLLWPVVVTVALFISLFTGLLWRCCDCGVVYIAIYWFIVTVALFISLFTGLLWRCCDCGVVYIAVYWFIVTLLWLALFISLFTGLWRCDCGVVYIAVYWFIVTLLCRLWRCLYRCLLVYCDVVVTVALCISLFTGLLWRCCDWRCWYRCLLIYCDVTVTLFILLLTDLLWPSPIAA